MNAFVPPGASGAHYVVMMTRLIQWPNMHLVIVVRSGEFVSPNMIGEGI